MTLLDLPHAQQEAVRGLIDAHVAETHAIVTLRIHPGRDGVCVYCVARHPAPRDAAEVFNRSGFHAHIGPQGGVKIL